MKAVQITTLQTMIAIVFAGIAGMSSPMVQRGLTRLMHRQGTAGNLPIIPNVEMGFELVGVVTVGGFLLVWACFVSANRQPFRGRIAKQGAIWFVPVALGVLGAMAAVRLRFSAVNPAPGAGQPAALQIIRNGSSAAVAALETFWLFAAILAVLMLLYFALVPIRPRRDGAGKTL